MPSPEVARRAAETRRKLAHRKRELVMEGYSVEDATTLARTELGLKVKGTVTIKHPTTTGVASDPISALVDEGLITKSTPKKSPTKEEALPADTDVEAIAARISEHLGVPAEPSTKEAPKKAKPKETAAAKKARLALSAKEEALLADDGGWALAEALVERAGSKDCAFHNVLLYGPPGTGKSYLASKHGGVPFHRVYLNEEMPSTELRGGPLPAKGEWEWIHAPGALAWLQGTRLVLDEVDKAAADTFTFLLGLLDDVEVAGLHLPNGEFIQPKQGFHVVATSNVDDPAELPEALCDRFIAVRITQPHPQALESLPEDLRAAAKLSCTAEPGRRVSMRGWKMYAYLREHFGPKAAAKAVFRERQTAILSSLSVAASPGVERGECSGCGEMTDRMAAGGMFVCADCSF